MRNIRLTLAYDGTNYVGWQVQPNGTSVQATVERAIHKLTGEETRLFAAGRTDSGVHALGQVANFHSNTGIPCEKIRSGLQNFLPADVVVRDVDEVPADFHATYSARSKHYRYVIHNSRVADPFLRRYAWQYAAALDAAAMHEAAQVLLGRHDFRCFESHFPNKATSVRTVIESRVARDTGWPIWSGSEREISEPDALASGCAPVGSRLQLAARLQGPDSGGQSGEFIRFDVAADGFLYNMVRAVVGTLVKVGLGKWSAEDVRRIIGGGDRSRAGETAPAHGLYLVRVEY